MLDRLERGFVAANKWVLIVLLSAMSLVIFANVAMRYTTNFSITWAEEFARYASIWMTFLGAGLALRFGGHVAITNLHDALPARPQRLLRLGVCLLLLAFFCVMIWIGYGYAERMQFQRTPATRISFSYIYAAIPIGFALMGVHLLLIMRRFVFENSYAETSAFDQQQATSL